MTGSPPKPRLEDDISIHIFTASAGMVGVCLTVISIVRVIITTKNVNTLADDLLATDAFLFLGSCALSYWALRTRRQSRMHRVERMADAVFLVALFLMVCVCAVITYAIV